MFLFSKGDIGTCGEAGKNGPKGDKGEPGKYYFLFPFLNPPIWQ